MVYQQFNSSFFENKLSHLICGFRSRYGTQDTLLNVNKKLQSYHDKSRVVSTVLIGFSKAFNCLSYELDRPCHWY